MHVIWHGNASVEIVCDQGRILFDPFVPLKGSPVPVMIDEFDGFDEIFVTHGHIDHIVNIPEIVRRNPKANVYCTKTPYQTLRKKGVPKRNLHRISYGKVYRVAGFTIRTRHGKHAVLPGPSFSRISYMLRSPARGNIPHFLREFLQCPEKDETVFYEISAEGKKVALLGSLNLREETAYPTGADLLVLPYNGWEDNYPPAVRILERLQPRRVLLDHYDDTFPPFTMPLDLTPILQAYPGRVKAMRLRRREEV